MPDLNAASLEAAIKTIEGTARSMGIEVQGMSRPERDGSARGDSRAEARKEIPAGGDQGRARPYPLDEAIELASEVAFAKFDETVEIAMRLGVDPKHADQMVRGTVVLPHGLGKTARVLVFASGEKIREAEEAGADYVGGEELAKKIEGGWLDFDAVVATPDMMRVVGRLGKVLGPRGLMPNPKAGTVTLDVAKAVQEIKAGKVEFRVDKTGIIHAPVGKISFGADQLKDNAEALIGAVLKAKPSAAKGKYVRGVERLLDHGPRHQGGRDRARRPPRRRRLTMALTRSDKEQLLAEYENGLAQAPHAFLLGYQGITVPQVTELRNKVRASGGEYSSSRTPWPCAPSTARPWRSSRSTSWARRPWSSARRTRSRWPRP